jgi:hypothetical protein
MYHLKLFSRLLNASCFLRLNRLLAVTVAGVRAYADTKKSNGIVGEFFWPSFVTGLSTKNLFLTES